MLPQTIIYIFTSILAVSLISLIGIFALSVNSTKLKKVLIYFIAFSAGALLGDAFIHLLPEIVEENGFTLAISIYLILGIGFSLVTEKIIHWRHCHHPTTKEHPHPLTTMNLIGEGVHNFIDGIIITASYLVSIPIGIATTIAVIFHEIPQEMSDFGVLVYGGYSKRKALLANFLISLTALAGAIITLMLTNIAKEVLIFLIPFAAGNFIYIASSDLIPELHKQPKFKTSLMQIVFFTLGILVMVGLIFIEF